MWLHYCPFILSVFACYSFCILHCWWCHSEGRQAGRQAPCWRQWTVLADAPLGKGQSVVALPISTADGLLTWPLSAEELSVRTGPTPLQTTWGWGVSRGGWGRLKGPARPHGWVAADSMRLRIGVASVWSDWPAEDNAAQHGSKMFKGIFCLIPWRCRAEINFKI